MPRPRKTPRKKIAAAAPATAQVLAEFEARIAGLDERLKVAEGNITQLLGQVARYEADPEWRAALTVGRQTMERLRSGRWGRVIAERVEK